MWSAWCENISCWSWLWKLKDLQYVSHYPRLNAVWFGFSRLVEEECDMILNGGYSCWASMAARFRSLENGSSQRKQCILRRVRDALLTLRHACPSLPSHTCGHVSATTLSAFFLSGSFFLVTLRSHSIVQVQNWSTRRVPVITILKVRMLRGHLTLSSRSLTSPGFAALFFQVQAKAEWEPQMSKLQMSAAIRALSVILVSLKLGKEKLVTSWQGPVP